MDPQKFHAKNGPSKAADIYSMAMTIHEVSLLRCISSPSAEVKVLTDSIPFPSLNDFMVMYHVIDGLRPEEPDFAKTRGYTKEVWEMTKSCWVVERASRPAVEKILDTLGGAAKQWKRKG